MLADEQPDGTLRTRVVDDFVPNTKERAVDLAATPEGDIVVAYMGGEVTRDSMATHQVFSVPQQAIGRAVLLAPMPKVGLFFLSATATTGVT